MATESTPKPEDMAPETDTKKEVTAPKKETTETDKATAEKETKETDKATAEKEKKETDKAATEKEAKETDNTATEKETKETDNTATKKGTKETDKTATEKETKETDNTATKKETKETDNTATEKETKETDKATTKTETNGTDSTSAGTETKGADTKELTPPSELEQKIIRQIEYYFGDHNLHRDRFLQAQVKENDGWVPIEVMCRFNRLKSLSEDHNVIAAALRKAKDGLMEVSEDNEKIRRSPKKPMPSNTQETRDDIRSRTIYAKGFPLDTSLDSVQEFLDGYGKTEHIQMRRGADHKFKGSVFVMFAKKEVAEKFLATEDLKYGDSETALLKMYKTEYYRKKGDDKRQLREDDMKKQEEAKEQQEDDDKQRFTERITKGAILVVSGVAGDTKVEELRTFFGEFGNVAWVDFESGDSEARVRFEKVDSAGAAWEKAKAAAEDGKVKIKESEVEGHVLEGDEELQHWKAIFRSFKERHNRNRYHQKFKRGRKGRQGGPPYKKRRSGGGDGRHDDEDDSDAEEETQEKQGHKRPTESTEAAPEAKQAKTEETKTE